MEGRPEGSSSSNQSANTRGTILVVEDEQLMLRVLKRTFSQQGYEVFTAADGEEAIEVYRSHKKEIDVVLLDIGLPKISGVIVFRKMKEDNPDVRIVIASGYLEPQVKAEMLRAGVKHFFLKPYMFQDIIDTFQTLIER
jgi:two-component system cell cycle sensor histidine kinase/response regulator CckA